MFCGFVWLKKPIIHCVHTCGGLTENDLAHIADGRRTPAYFSKKLALWYRHCIHLWLLCIVLCIFLVIRLYSCFVSAYCVKSPCGYFGSLCFVFLCIDLLTVRSCTAEWSAKHWDNFLTYTLCLGARTCSCICAYIQMYVQCNWIYIHWHETGGGLRRESLANLCFPLDWESFWQLSMDWSTDLD